MARLGGTILVLIVALATAARGQSAPDYGFQWVTVGAPGNRGTLPNELPLTPDVSRGAVGYEYRITTSKLDNNSYLEFVNAYAPFWHGDPRDFRLTGYWIQAYDNGNGTFRYGIQSGSEHYAARINWEMAARYCNWLCNGKINAGWAFESGAYDTSTFFRDGNGVPHHQLIHSAGARYWIPSLDEWIKAAYYDPDKNGPGMEGYWRYPNATDSPLREALPEDGGETIGDLLWRSDPGRDLGAWDLRQYPNTQSPWGLLDISATVPDYTSTDTTGLGTITGGGSLAGDTLYFTYDQLQGVFFPLSVDTGDLGDLRLASIVPAPNVMTMFCLLLYPVRRKRR